MLLGILLKAMNALYFHQLVDFFFEALPQLFLFISLIGYMTFLILYKWITPVDEFHPKPSLINVLIDMNMSTGGGGKGGEDTTDSSLIMFDGQAEVQQVKKDLLSYLFLSYLFLSFFPIPFFLPLSFFLISFLSLSFLSLSFFAVYRHWR